MMYLRKQWSQPDHISSVGPCTWGFSSPLQSSNSQFVRSRYMMLFATQNKSTTEQEGDRKLSADRIWAKCCGKIHMSCTQVQGSQMSKECKNCSLSVFLSLSYWNGYLIKPFFAWPFYWDPERVLLFQYHIPFPSSEHQASPRSPKPCWNKTRALGVVLPSHTKTANTSVKDQFAPHTKRILH